MNLYVLLLLVVPIIFGVLFLLNDNKSYYKFLSYGLFILGTVFSVLLAINGPIEKIAINGSTFTVIEGIVVAIEVLIIVFLFYVSIKHKRLGVITLTVIQSILFIYSTFFMEKHEEILLSIDNLSIVMLLIVNIIGTLIVVFANGYITEYEHHRHMKSRQKLFYFVISIFLSAMNGLVMSDSLSWVFFFWEITTLASFLLISYNQDEEAFNSGFRALFLNLIGGLCFALGNILLQNQLHITTLSEITAHGSLTGLAMIPVFLLCIAGFAKSAQMPFHSWLLGAMVAPTPVSALLHSSTMVKAGVYLIIKLSPAYAGTFLGTSIAIFAAFSFLVCSAIAVSQRNAKRILAYSTIANLGLIICAAGLGTTIAISAAILLTIFHAISKALMFLCAGQIEHTINSRDVEDMAGLINKAPVLTLIAVFGMASMLLPPFGVLVGKWLSIEASSANPIVAILIVLGSALTTVFWLKWMGSVLSRRYEKFDGKEHLTLDIYFPLLALAAMALVTSALIAPIFNGFVLPEVNSLIKANSGIAISNAKVISDIGSFNGFAVFIILGITVVMYLLFSNFLVGSAKIKRIYMSGENNQEDPEMFRHYSGSYHRANVSNVYLYRIFDEKKLTKIGYIGSILIIIAISIGGLL